MTKVHFGKSIWWHDVGQRGENETWRPNIDTSTGSEREELCLWMVTFITEKTTRKKVQHRKSAQHLGGKIQNKTITLSIAQGGLGLMEMCKWNPVKTLGGLLWHSYRSPEFSFGISNIAPFQCDLFKDFRMEEFPTCSFLLRWHWGVCLLED